MYKYKKNNFMHGALRAGVCLLMLCGANSAFAQTANSTSVEKSTKKTVATKEISGHVYDDKKSFGYNINFTDPAKYTAAYKKLFEKQIIPLVKRGLCATVYTQVSDVEFEVNGLLTYDREILKIDADVAREINSQLKY